MLSGFVKCAAAACAMEINRLLIISVYSFRHTVSCPETLDCELLSPTRCFWYLIREKCDLCDLGIFGLLHRQKE